MISELVVSASILMLSAAQHIQIPPYHVVQLPNLQPAQLPSVPNTQLFMIQRANTILGEDVGTPLEPGLFTAGQVSVGDTAQNILSQESQVVGYNLQNGLPQAQVVQQQSLPQQFFVPHQGTQFVTLNLPNQVNQGYLPNIPKLIPVTHEDAISGDKRAQLEKYRNTPHSLTIPVLNNLDNRHIVPLRAMASLKTLLGPEKQFKDTPYFTFKNKPSAQVPPLQHGKYASHSLPRPNSIQFSPHVNLYDDIQANYPVPPPSQLQSQTHSMFYTQENTNSYEDRSRSPNYPMQPSQPQTNSIRYAPETANSYEDKSRSPNYPPQSQTNPIRYVQETANSYEDRSRSPNYSTPPSQSQPNPIRSNPQHTNIYYDIPPNHPVPPPPSDSNKNTFDEISLIQRLKQESSDIPAQSFLLPSKDSAGEYAPARPPPLSAQNSYIQHNREEEIINMMPPLPYREVYIPENFTESSSPPLLQPQSQPDKDLSAALSTAMKNILPPRIEEESSKEAGQSVKDTTTERVLPATYKPTEPVKEEFEKPKKTLPRKSKLRSESKGAGAAHADSETSNSENFYQQAPVYQNNDYSNEGNRGYGYNSESHSSPNRDVVHKHIFVHAAPDYQSHAPRVRVIRPQYDNEKHVNIIFVKSPPPPPEPQTIVELPPRDQPKTFVYVLSKKPQDEAKENVKIIGPAPSKPLAPEIFFIRYGTEKGNKGYPVPNLQSLYDNYGALSNPQPQLVRPPSGLVPPRPLMRRGLFRHKRDKDYGLDVYAPLMSYSNTGQINEITREEADTRSTKLEDFF